MGDAGEEALVEPEVVPPLPDTELEARQVLFGSIFEGFVKEKEILQMKLKSVNERKAMGLEEDPGKNKSFTYSELDVNTMHMLLNRVKEQFGPLYVSKGIFLDLGSGAGKPCVAAGLLHPFEKVVGIECMQCLNDAANAAAAKYAEAEMPPGAVKPEIQFIKGDFVADFDAQIAPIAPQVSVCLAVATCYGQDQLQTMAKVAQGMPTNSIFIAFSQGLPDSLLIDHNRYSAHRKCDATKKYLNKPGKDPDTVDIVVDPPKNDPEGWTLLVREVMEMSWGSASCFIYKKHSFPSQACANNGGKGLYISGECKCCEDVLNDNVDLVEFKYIVGVKEEAKEALLAEMKEQYPEWSPDSVLASMPMFVGKLDGEKIKFLLDKDEVTFIEADGEIPVPEPPADA